jgi:copper(I)-binding protein
MSGYIRFVNIIIFVLATVIFGCTSENENLDGHDYNDELGMSQSKVHTGEIVRHVDINIVDVWARPGFRGGNSAIYMDLSNVGDGIEYLIGAEAEICTTIEIHQIRMQEDVMTMFPVGNDIEILSGQTVSFEPGGLHFMMIDLDADLAPEGHFQMQLIFKFAGPVLVNVIVPET